MMRERYGDMQMRYWDDSGWDYDDWTGYALEVSEATARCEYTRSTIAHKSYVFELCRRGMRHLRWMLATDENVRERTFICHWSLVCADWLGIEYMTAQTAIMEMEVIEPRTN